MVDNFKPDFQLRLGHDPKAWEEGKKALTVTYFSAELFSSKFSDRKDQL